MKIFNQNTMIINRKERVFMRKIDYQKTFDVLLESKEIEEGDKYAVCLFRPESHYYGVMTTTTTSNFDYIMSANDNEVKLFEIDKKTGEYLNSKMVFKKSDLVFEKKNKNWVFANKSLFGQRNIGIRYDAENFNHTYYIPKKLHGFVQDDRRVELYDFIKKVYNAHHDKMKQQYKESK